VAMGFLAASGTVGTDRIEEQTSPDVQVEHVLEAYGNYLVGGGAERSSGIEEYN